MPRGLGRVDIYFAKLGREGKPCSLIYLQEEGCHATV